jgi:hypothetical protein
MRIAIPVDEKSIKTSVCQSFGRAPYFLIYDTDSKESKFIDNSAAASQGGKWDSARKMWSIDERNVDAVRQVLREIYGMDDTPTELVSVRVKTLVSIYADRGPITIFGRVVANATGRDSGARIGEGVVFVTGNAKSGGSTKYWETIISEDSEFIIHDIPFCTFPITLSFSDKAFSGQNNAHPPQEWQTSSNIFNVPLM